MFINVANIKIFVRSKVFIIVYFVIFNLGNLHKISRRFPYFNKKFEVKVFSYIPFSFLIKGLTCAFSKVILSSGGSSTMLILDPKILIIWVLLDKDLKKLFSCLKSAPSNLWKCELSCWKNQIEFRNKTALFGIIWMNIFKNFCHHWNQHLQIY